MIAQDVIDVLEPEIGYHEKATNSQLDSKTANSGSGNFTKFGRDLHKAGYYNGNKNGYPWCDQTVDWGFWKAADEDKETAEYIQCQSGPYGAGCGYSMQYYQDAGRFDKTPKVGDQIFFRYKGTKSGADHTGLVVAVTATTVTTIEGNSGDQVQKHTYSRNHPDIYGYGHPRYDGKSTRKSAKQTTKQEVKTVDINLPVLKKGSTGPEVKTVQRILRQLGYVGVDGKLIKVDGELGENTEFAIKKFQGDRGSTLRDGIVGIWTWNKLLKG